MHWALIYVLNGGVLFDTNLRYEDIKDCAADWVEARKKIDQMKFTVVMDDQIARAGYCLPVRVDDVSKPSTNKKTFRLDE